jgi:phosphoribosyl 1,2-cyclic phosphodiesterase
MRVRFWGVRGWVPWAVPNAIGHGCNTPCIEILDERTGAILILDAGSGIVGVNPAALSPAPCPISLLLTHYHWDHLQGLPFFATLYQPGWELTLHAPALAAHDPSWLDTVFKSPFFPVPYQHLPNRPRVELVRSGELSIPGFEVTARNLNHPGGALAYRIRGMTGDFVYATDHEFGDPDYDEPLATFARGAAALVLDAHFTPQELPQHRGWGHSDWRQCSQFAAANDIGGLWLFHHRPGRSDEELVRIRTDARRIFGATETASEGDALQL